MRWRRLERSNVPLEFELRMLSYSADHPLGLVTISLGILSMLASGCLGRVHPDYRPLNTFYLGILQISQCEERAHHRHSSAVSLPAQASQCIPKVVGPVCRRKTLVRQGDHRSHICNVNVWSAARLHGESVGEKTSLPKYIRPLGGDQLS